MPWIDKIVQIGMRGIGSARDGEVKDAINYGAEIIDANGMDLVEIAPRYDVGNITMVHAERLICNFIGAAVRAGYYEG